MTVDVNVRSADAAFLDDIDEIIEETMVQMFILQPRDRDELEAAKRQANEHPPLFYCAPLTLGSETDGNCVALFVDDADALASSQLPERPLFVDEARLDETTVRSLGGHRGVILNATRPHDELGGFFIAIGPGNVGKFDPDSLAALPMERIVLQSGYPEYGFDEILLAVKAVSDTMFRPDESIVAAATKSALTLLGFKKG